MQSIHVPAGLKRPKTHRTLIYAHTYTNTHIHMDTHLYTHSLKHNLRVMISFTSSGGEMSRVPAD